MNFLCEVLSRIFVNSHVHMPVTTEKLMLVVLENENRLFVTEVRGVFYSSFCIHMPLMWDSNCKTNELAVLNW